MMVDVRIGGINEIGSGAVRPLNVVGALIGTNARWLPAAFWLNKITLVTHRGHILHTIRWRDCQR